MNKNLYKILFIDEKVKMLVATDLSYEECEDLIKKQEKPELYHISKLENKRHKIIKNIANKCSIKEDKIITSHHYSKENVIGTNGKDDLIRRQETIDLIKKINIEVSNAMEKNLHTNNYEGLRNIEELLTYLMWALREMPSG